MENSVAMDIGMSSRKRKAKKETDTQTKKVVKLLPIDEPKIPDNDKSEKEEIHNAKQASKSVIEDVPKKPKQGFLHLFNPDPSIYQVYSRGADPKIEPKVDTSEDFLFMSTQSDYTLTKPVEGITDSYKEVPLIRFYGCRKDGASVQLNIYNVYPYFYVPAPSGYTEEHNQLFVAALNSVVDKNGSDALLPSVLDAEIVHTNTVMKYTFGEKKPFIKITLRSPQLVVAARQALERGIVIQGSAFTFRTYESNVPFVLRMMIDTGIVGGGWIRVKAGGYHVLKKSDPSASSHCQIEVNTSLEHVKGLDPEKEMGDVARVRILSFDIECNGRRGVFPNPDYDSVIQISNIMTVQGEESTKKKMILTLNTCAAINGADVLSFESERDLLRHWQRFVLEYDPDIIIGYNTANFDFPFLLNRAKTLGIRDFNYLGRVSGSQARIKVSTFKSRAYGTRENNEMIIDGRNHFDMLSIITREHKLRSYTLNAVSAHFLGEQKEDVNHSQIPILQAGNHETRKRLAIYCIKDSLLTQRLFEKLMIFYNYLEMARVTGVPMEWLIYKGQQIKVFSQLLRKTMLDNLVVPFYSAKGAADDTYEGATVIEPSRGYYDTPIATLDFASLYPSIQVDYNLSHDTLLDPADVKKLQPDQMHMTPQGDYFVEKSVKKGILVVILEHLLSARKKAKRDLANEKDPQKKAVFDGRQLALKISANSVYGFTGATVGKLPCTQIASAVTAYGRDMIFRTKQLVEEEVAVANGYDDDAVVIYGDTDSVMINFGKTPIDRCMAQAKELSKKITVRINEGKVDPIGMLDFEKIYYPYLLINKKRYAGVFWTRPDYFDKIDVKGLESVRRDNCLLTKNMVDGVIHRLLLGKDLTMSYKLSQSNKQSLLEILRGKAIQQALQDGGSSEARDYLNKAAPDVLKADLGPCELSARVSALSKKAEEDNAYFPPSLRPKVSVPQCISGSSGSQKIKEAQDFVKKNLSDLLTDKVDISQLIISKAMSKTAEEYKGKQTHTELAARMRARDPATAPVTGDRVPYVMVGAAKGAKAYEKAEDPIYVLEHGIPIDYDWYVKQQLTKPITRLFSEVMDRPESLFFGDHMLSKVVQSGTSGGLGKFMVKTEKCIGCKVPLAKGEEGATCRYCKEKEALLYSDCCKNLREAEKAYGEMWTECQRCQGSMTQDVLCTNRDCPIFYARQKARINLKSANKTIDRFNLDW